EAGRVAGHALHVGVVAGLRERLDGGRMRSGQPLRMLGRVAALAHLRPDVFGGGRQQPGAGGAAPGQDAAALLRRQREDGRVGGVRDARQEGRVLEAERVLLVVALRAGRRVVVVHDRGGREVRTSAAVAVLAADALELRLVLADLVAAVLAEADHVAADALR